MARTVHRVGYYSTAQVCTSGHVATSDLENYPECSEKFCSRCGATTISSCPQCKASIRGSYNVPGVFGGFGYTPPSYCFNCGAAFPWTAERINAAQELADEIDGLKPDERRLLKQSITELTTDTARTNLAAVRYKKLIMKIGAEGASALNKILVEIATGGAKKLLGL